MVMEAIPLDTLGGEPSPEAPKRGRRPALNPDGTRKHPPRKPSGSARRKPSRRAPSKPRTASLAPEIAAMLTLANGLIIMSPLGTRPYAAIDDPDVVPERVGDELDAAEIGALAGSIDAQCRRSPRFRKVVEGFLTAGAGGQLVGVVAMIAARRAARHGLAPAYIDPMLGMMLAGDGVAAMADFTPTPTPEPRGPDDEPMPDHAAVGDDSGVDFDALA